MKVTLAQLQVFVALSDTLHFTRAAEALSVSQPTISKEIKALERGLGIQLLNRSSGGTTLTPAGRSLQGHARAVITQVTEFEASAEVVKSHARREVRIAASPSIVNRLLPETLRKFDDRDLGITLVAIEVETGEVVAAVDSGRADIGVGHHLTRPRRATKRRLGEDELQVVISRSLAPKAGTPLDLGGLTQVPLLMWPRERSPAYHDAIIEICRARGLDPLLLTGTTRISGSWSFFLDDARAFALAPRDFAAQETGGHLTALSLNPPGFVPLDVVWIPGNPAADEVLAILWDITDDRRADHAAAT